MSGANLMPMHDLIEAAVDPCACDDWTPAELELTGFWDASYGGAPWLGTDSAGISGGEDLILVDNNLPRTHTAPAVGSLVNGFAPAEFDGRMFLNSDPVEAMQLDTPNAFGTYANATAFSCWVVAKITERGAPNAHSGGMLLTVYDDASGSRPFGLYLTSGGAAGSVQATTGGITSASRNPGSGIDDIWVMATFRYDGANIQVGINEAPGTEGGTSVAYSTALTVATAGQINIGMERFVLHIQETAFAGDMLQIGTADYWVPDSEWCKILCAARTKFDLPLVAPS